MNADEKQATDLKQDIQNFNTPEDINNSSVTSSSKRLERVFAGYNKTTDG